MSVKVNVTEKVASFLTPNGVKILELPVYQYTEEDLKPAVDALGKYKEDQAIKNLQARALLEK